LRSLGKDVPQASYDKNQIQCKRRIFWEFFDIYVDAGSWSELKN